MALYCSGLFGYIELRTSVWCLCREKKNLLSCAFTGSFFNSPTIPTSTFPLWFCLLYSRQDEELWYLLFSSSAAPFFLGTGKKIKLLLTEHVKWIGILLSLKHINNLPMLTVTFPWFISYYSWSLASSTFSQTRHSVAVQSSKHPRNKLLWIT